MGKWKQCVSCSAVMYHLFYNINKPSTVYGVCICIKVFNLVVSTHSGRKSPSLWFLSDMFHCITVSCQSASWKLRKLFVRGFDITRPFYRCLKLLNGHSVWQVLMATNRPDTLDPALMRPGRLDRKVEFGLPDLEGRTHIFKIHARSMSVERDIRFELLARLCPNSTGKEPSSLYTLWVWEVPFRPWSDCRLQGVMRGIFVEKYYTYFSHFIFGFCKALDL